MYLLCSRGVQQSQEVWVKAWLKPEADTSHLLESCCRTLAHTPVLIDYGAVLYWLLNNEFSLTPQCFPVTLKASLAAPPGGVATKPRSQGIVI